MKKEEKEQLIETLVEDLNNNNHIYLIDISGFNVQTTYNLRKICFNNSVKLKVVKNTLLKKAIEKFNNNHKEPFNKLLEGSTTLMFSDIANLPAKIIKDFRRINDKPILKGAFIEDMFYIGDEQLYKLVDIKSKNELIGDIIGLLQAPIKNIISGLQSTTSYKILNVLKTLKDKFIE